MSESSKAQYAAYPVKAGTRLGPRKRPLYHEWTRPGDGRTAKVCNGYLDIDAGLFQGGGERHEILNMTAPTPLLSFHEDVWRQLRAPWNRVTRLEMIDHGRNEVYVIRLEDAEKVARPYYTSSGPRWGVPEPYTTLYDCDGAVIRAALPIPAQDALEFGKPAPRVKPARPGQAAFDL